jgi:hypothetical protein
MFVATSGHGVLTAIHPPSRSFPMKIRTSLLAIALVAVTGTAFAQGAAPAAAASPAADSSMASDAAAPAAKPMAKHQHRQRQVSITQHASGIRAGSPARYPAGV